MVVNWKVKMGKDQWGKKERSKEVRIGVERNKKKDQQQWGITPVPIRMVIMKKNLQTINAGEDMEKREPSYTVGGNVNWYSHYGEQNGGSWKTKNKITIWPSNHTTGHIPKENHNSKRHMKPNVHCSAIYNSQDMEAT